MLAVNDFTLFIDKSFNLREVSGCEIVIYFMRKWSAWCDGIIDLGDSFEVTNCERMVMMVVSVIDEDSWLDL